MKLLAFVAALTVGLAGCSGLGDSIGDAVAEKATDKILTEVEASIHVKDAFVDGLTHVYVSFGEVALLGPSGWIAAKNDVKEIDLLDLQGSDAKAEIAKFTVNVGDYTAARLSLTALRAENANGPVAVVLKTEVIEIDLLASLTQDFALLVDFDLAKSFNPDGSFEAAIKNVQLSTNDADGDGRSDFDDSDDDNDGVNDHEDADIDGDGKEDPPKTTPRTFKETKDQFGNSGAYDKISYTGLSWDKSVARTIDARTGFFGGSGPIGFETGGGFHLLGTLVYNACAGKISMQVTVSQMVNNEPSVVERVSATVDCGWAYIDFDSPLFKNNDAMLTFSTPVGGIAFLEGIAETGLSAPSSTSTSSTVTSSSTSTSSSSTTTSSSSTTSSSTASTILIQGESMTGGNRANAAFEGTMLRWDESDPLTSTGFAAPWDFTFSGSGSYTARAHVLFNCDDPNGTMDVGFSFEDTMVDDTTWLWYDYNCATGFTTLNLAELGSFPAGNRQIFVAYDYSVAALGVDYFELNPAANG